MLSLFRLIWSLPSVVNPESLKSVLAGLTPSCLICTILYIFLPAFPVLPALSDFSLSCLWFLMLDTFLPLNLLSALLSSRMTAWKR